MLQKLDYYVADALARAAAADRRARDATDPELQFDNERMAHTWRFLARCFRFAESLERFLIESQTNRNLQPPAPPNPHPWE
jgi:hypothetical protein